MSQRFSSLLTGDFTCKIGDFGLSRQLYALSEYVKQSKEPLPWRWMAPESLKSMEFTIMSDVWGYGVTMWEVFSLGTLPYPGTSWTPDFVNQLENGMRFGKAEFATDELHEMLLKCCHIRPEERPTFEELGKFFAEKRNIHYLQLGDA